MKQYYILRLEPFLAGSHNMTLFDCVSAALVRSRNEECSLATCLLLFLSKYISKTGDSVVYINFYVSNLLYMFVHSQALCNRITDRCIHI